MCLFEWRNKMKRMNHKGYELNDEKDSCCYANTDIHLPPIDVQWFAVYSVVEFQPVGASEVKKVKSWSEQKCCSEQIELFKWTKWRVEMNKSWITIWWSEWKSLLQQLETIIQRQCSTLLRVEWRVLQIRKSLFLSHVSNSWIYHMKPIHPKNRRYTPSCWIFGICEEFVR